MSSPAETRAARLKLPVAKKPIFTKIGPGLGVGYRRNTTAGTWVVRAADGKGGNWTKAIGTADDFDEADGKVFLDFWQAQDRARAIARVGRAGDGDDGRPVTIAKALDQYQADLKIRGGDAGNVARVRAHLADTLADKTVALVTARDLRSWRDGLAKELAPATVNRTANGLKAALNVTSIVVRGGLGSDCLAFDDRHGPLPSARLFGGGGQDELFGGSERARRLGGSESDTLLAAAAGTPSW